MKPAIGNPFGFDNRELVAGNSFDSGDFSSDDHMTSFSDEF